MELRSIQDARRVNKDGQWTFIHGISGITFYIKPYQRGYRWGKNNARKLLEDIREYVKSFGHNEDSILTYISAASDVVEGTGLFDFYCLQALAVKREGDENEFELIDGQQRLTTIFLVYDLLEVFCNPEDDRESSPYRIVYQRGGAEENEYDLTGKIHGITSFKVGNDTPRRAYRKGAGNRSREWFDEYKAKLKEQILGLQSSEVKNALSIDLYYLSEVAEEIVDFIYEFNDNEKDSRMLEHFWAFIRQNVFFLWYEIPREISAEEEFESLNT